MKTIGIIAEFNPFHKGHEYFIDEAKKLSGADSVVVVMSGDYVQRGECAIWDKFRRAEMAVICGADMVPELPVVFSTGSARDFAYGAVSLLDNLGVIDELWFGSESGDMRLFDVISGIFADEPVEYSDALRSNLKCGMSFPAARAAAFASVFGNDPGFIKKYDLDTDAVLNKKTINTFLSSPNNILGIEYCLALKKLKSNIVPKTLTRLGGGYNDKALNSKYSSASAIRLALADKRFGDAFSALPASITANFDIWDLFKKTLCIDDFSLILRYILMRESAESLSNFRDVGIDLARRIKQHENDFRTFSQFAMLLKNKSTTYSHICRALIHIILGLTDADFESAVNANHIRLLGINKSNSALLSAAKANSRASLCPKPSALKDGSYDKELFASNLYESVYAHKFNAPFTHEYRKQMIIKN